MLSFATVDRKDGLIILIHGEGIALPIGAMQAQQFIAEIVKTSSIVVYTTSQTEFFASERLTSPL